jgi:glycosyltransferase involved in cell wall biosynthesis
MKIVINQIPDLKLIIAGNGSLDSEDMEIIKSYPNNIELRNEWIADSDVWDIFDSTDMTIVPYIDASQSGVVATSLSLGRMVIASDSGGLKEQVEPSGGIVVEAGDSEILAKAIITLYNDVEQIKQLNKRAYDYAMKELTWEHSADLLLELIYQR